MLYRYLCTKDFYSDIEYLGGTATLTSTGVAADGTTYTTLPAVAHGFSAGDLILISGTTAYDKVWTLDSNTAADLLGLATTYIAETIATAYARTIQKAARSRFYKKGLFYDFPNIQYFAEFTLQSGTPLLEPLNEPLLLDLQGTVKMPRSVFATLWVPAQAIALAAAGDDPARQAVYGYLTFVKDSTDFIYLSVRLPRGTKSGPRVRFKVMYIPVANTGGTARLTLSYGRVRDSLAIPSLTAIALTETVAENLYAHEADLGEVHLSTCAADDVLLLKFQRTTNGGTYTFDNSINLVGIEVAVEQDALGSGLSDGR